MELSKENLKKRSEALVIAIVGKKLAEKWWNSPNKAFEGELPLNQFAKDPKSVYEYLLRHSEGEW